MRKIERGIGVFWGMVGICVFVACGRTELFAQAGSGGAAATAERVTGARTELEPGPKPTDTTKSFKELVGVYRADKEHKVVVLETSGVLFAKGENGVGGALEARKDGTFWWPSTFETDRAIGIERDASGKIVAVNMWERRYARVDAGSDAKSFFRVTPVRPLEVLRKEALAAKPPEEAGPFRKPELVELTTLDPGFRLDIGYATTNNFLSTPVYSEARAFLQKPAAEALERVLQKLRPMGYGLLIHDAYRPWYVTKIFWDATPVADHIFVADPQKGSKHNRGCAVDLTLYDLATGATVEMPGLYDEMSERSFPDFPGGTSLQRWNRELLRRAMESEGFTVEPSEWWHFDYRDWKSYGILNERFEEVK